MPIKLIKKKKKKKKNVSLFNQPEITNEQFFEATPCAQCRRWSSHTKIPSSLKYREKSIFHLKKSARKETKERDDLMFKHVAQHTCFLKRKCEIQISHRWKICQHCLVSRRWRISSTQYRVPLRKNFLHSAALSLTTCWGRYRGGERGLVVRALHL